MGAAYLLSANFNRNGGVKAVASCFPRTGGWGEGMGNKLTGNMSPTSIRVPAWEAWNALGRPMLMGEEKEKARFGYPPGSLKARFFQSHWALPSSFDFPPEIKDELNEAWLLG